MDIRILERNIIARSSIVVALQVNTELVGRCRDRIDGDISHSVIMHVIFVILSIVREDGVVIGEETFITVNTVGDVNVNVVIVVSVIKDVRKGV